MSWNLVYDDDFDLSVYNADNYMYTAYCGNPEHKFDSSIINVRPLSNDLDALWYNYNLIDFDIPNLNWDDIFDRVYQPYLYRTIGRTAIYEFYGGNNEIPDFLDRNYSDESINAFIDKIRSPIMNLIRGFEHSKFYIVVYGSGLSQDISKYPFGFYNRSYNLTNYDDSMIGSVIPENYFLGLGSFSLYYYIENGTNNYAHRNSLIARSSYDQFQGYNVIGLSGFFDTDIPVYSSFVDMCYWIWEKDMSNISDVKSHQGMARKGLCNICKIEQSSLNELKEYIAGGALNGNISDGIVSLKMISHPGSVSTSGSIPLALSTSYATKAIIAVANKLGDLVGGVSLSDISANLLTNQFEKYNLGSASIQSFTDSYVDYRCRVQIYLPFAGMYNIDPRLVIDKTVNLHCVVDYVNGYITYYLSDPAGNIVNSWSGNCSMDMPIIASDFSKILSSMAGGMISAGAIAATGSVSSLATSQTRIAGGVSNGGNVITCGNISGNAGWAGPKTPYLLLTRPNVTYPSNYASLHGYPCNMTATLSSLSGYTEATCHVEIPGATSEEKAMIESALKSGVIL